MLGQFFRQVLGKGGGELGRQMGLDAEGAEGGDAEGEDVAQEVEGGHFGAGRRVIGLLDLGELLFEVVEITIILQACEGQDAFCGWLVESGIRSCYSGIKGFIELKGTKIGSKQRY